MNNYKGMSSEEIKTQLEWSDSHEFSYDYSMWAFDEIERLHSIIKEVREYATRHMMDLAEIKGKNGEANGAILIAISDLVEILDKVEEK